MRHAFLTAWTLLAVGAAAANESGQRGLTFDDRVEAQRAIEQVYWNHRIWPKENPGPKPRLSAVMSDETIRAKVEDYLEKSNALEKFWHRPIAAHELQAELDRMADNSRDPKMLRELFAVMGNDPSLIAETLARQTLADRLIRSWYATDSRLHANLKLAANAALAACATVECLKAMGGNFDDTTWRRRANVPEDASRIETDRALTLDGDEWREHVDRLAAQLSAKDQNLPVGRLSRLEESREAFFVTTVLAARVDEIVTGRVSWPKRSFDAWWSAERVAVRTELLAPSGNLVLPTVPSSACTDDTWAPTRFEVPDPRFGQKAVWTGTEMIVWGGNAGGNNGPRCLNTGGRYNPSTDTWTVTSTGPNVPSGRELHTAVWTGTEMIVWGGWNGSVDFNNGGRYNPNTDTWSTTGLGANLPAARRAHSAIWTGSQMIVWGGTDGPYWNTGGRYDPTTDKWAATSTGANVPAGRAYHTVVWSGSQMIVWGGHDGSLFNSGGRYDPVTDAWAATSMGTNLPTARWSHSGVWTGTEMIVWGGNEGINTGARYNPSTDAWAAISRGANVPAGRARHTAVWTGTEMLIWGGSVFPAGTTGGRYNPTSDTWKRTSTGANVPAAREEHTAVWTGTEMIVWGGSDDHSTDANANTGGRYAPGTDSWVATSLGAQVSAARSQHTAVWTGAEMIVWGGNDGFGSVNSGGRYSPSTDSSTPTSTGTDVPTGRALHKAVWTGSQMIVWGGYDFKANTFFNMGGRYNPLTDSWSPTSTGANVPAGRYANTLVWTGTEAIVWAGYNGLAYVNSGGRYNPTTDTWFPTSTGANVPTTCTYPTAVWTGTEMIVWGGYSGAYLFTGGRYDPMSDTWRPTTTSNVPLGRAAHTAVWTGMEMVVWGGTGGAAGVNTGGRYYPASDTWMATSTGTGDPPGRQFPTSVWTGKEMIVWGGSAGSPNFLNTGGRYDPSTDTWALTSTGANVPSGRNAHTAAWTGTQMIIWGGSPTTSSGGLYCGCPDGRLYYRDADGDGFGDTGNAKPSCDGTIPAGYIAVGLDCNDSDPAVRPSAVDTCNQIDDDCNGLTDEGALGEDSDGDRVHELCDNCAAVWNPNQSDIDHDGEGDACDLDDGLIYVFATDKNAREWQTESGYTSWNSYRGALSVLRATGQYTQAPGSNPLESRDCGVGVGFIFDPVVPAPGDIAFHLVTGVSFGVESGLGTNSAGVPRANANPCP